MTARRIKHHELIKLEAYARPYLDAVEGTDRYLWGRFTDADPKRLTDETFAGHARAKFGAGWDWLTGNHVSHMRTEYEYKIYSDRKAKVPPPPPAPEPVSQAAVPLEWWKRTTALEADNKNLQARVTDQETRIAQMEKWLALNLDYRPVTRLAKLGD